MDACKHKRESGCALVTSVSFPLLCLNDKVKKGMTTSQLFKAALLRRYHKICKTPSGQREFWDTDRHTHRGKGPISSHGAHRSSRVGLWLTDRYTEVLLPRLHLYVVNFSFSTGPMLGCQKLCRAQCGPSTWRHLRNTLRSPP